MPEVADLAGVAKWIAIMLVPISALWGLLARKPTIEDSTGKKRLTRAGYVTLLLTTGSALISGLSFAVESRAKEKAKLEDDLARARSAATLSNTRAGLVATRNAQLQQRLDDLTNRTLAMMLANEARVRDLELARRVDAGTVSNLARTTSALVQLGRVLQPLEPLTLQVTWEIPATAPGIRAWRSRILPDVRRAEERHRETSRIASYRSRMPFRPLDRMTFANGGPNYPQYARATERDLFACLSTIGATALAFDGNNSAANIIAGLKATGQSVQPSADLRLDASAPDGPPSVLYRPATGISVVSLSTSIPLAAMNSTGVILSYPDLEHAIVLVEVGGACKETSRQLPLRLKELTITGRTRTYILPSRGVRLINDIPDRALFLLPRLTGRR